MEDNVATRSKPSAAAGAPLCPSVQCSTDAKLIGVVGPDGTISYVRPALPVSQKFADAVNEHGRPTTRFRFTGPCIQTGCRNWGENKCQIVEKEVIDAGRSSEASESAGPLPSCSIRANCVWFAQRRLEACRACPHVITDVYIGS